MKLLNIKVKGLNLFEQELEIDFLTKQKVIANQDEGLFNVFKTNRVSAYTNNVLSFIGINASGKTSTLEVISFVLDMLMGEPINKNAYKEILNKMGDNNEVIFEACFWTENNEVCKLITTITKNREDLIKDKEFIISDERLYIKKDTSIANKKNILNFENSKPEQVRTGDEAFLLDDVSIIVATNKRLQSRIIGLSLTYLTNRNALLDFELKDYPIEFIKFLDPSIEYLKWNELKNKKTELILKFKNSNEIVLENPKQLENYLSSGTIKGMNVFFCIFAILKGGKYLVIDELENHFNKEIVATIIRIFKDSELNPNGATLIFTTHYAEILDEFERNDSIYIVKNENGIRVNNLSDLLTRNDLKKSEVYSSDFLNGTAPSYTAYMDMRKIIAEKVVRKID